jgi:L-amino acid N-acyltransferase YncA
MITAMLPRHAEEVLEIYRHGIESGVATFETQSPAWEKFSGKYLPVCRFVSMDGDVVTGWAALSAVSPRECYKGVAEVSVYVHRGHWGKGIGKNLLQQLVTGSEQHGIWSLLSMIHEENPASIQLHYNCGFRMIGYREKLAQLHGDWKTVVMMERRSKITGG